MIELTHEQVERYLQEALGKDVRLTAIGDIGSLDEQGIKDFGYGKPLLIRWEREGKVGEAVISAMRGDSYGHQDYWDRARITMFQYETGARMKRHVRPLGMGYVNGTGRLVPVRGVKEFFIVNEKLRGKDYFLDLERIREGDFREDDLELAREFARWLGRDVHANKSDQPDRYIRRVRNLIGDCECIYGIVDGYPHPYDEFPPERFIELEKRLVAWRWKLRNYTHRLAEVHGDFHPWNVLVHREGGETDFRVLDRSRGVWGEPAGDVATMSMNYALFGLLDGKPKLEGPFKELFEAFWETWIKTTGDEEAGEVVAPFYVFRALVVASPEWYPGHAPEVRRALFRFLENVLDTERFDYKDFNKYLE